jgi:deazaflavin-dependent oxidoreductase (nitroreductase family)
MASWQWFGTLHRKAFELTGGRIGARLLWLDVLLLTTTGRRSGLRRTTPMPYWPDGERFVLVGSNGGEPRDPAWWLNLQADPHAEVQVREGRFAVVARLAGGEERARLWPQLKAWNRIYVRYEEKTDREIPVVVLEKRIRL